MHENERLNAGDPPRAKVLEPRRSHRPGSQGTHVSTPF